LLICTEPFVWLTHQSLINLEIFGATFGIGVAIGLIAPPRGYAPACDPQKSFKKQALTCFRMFIITFMLYPTPWKIIEMSLSDIFIKFSSHRLKYCFRNYLRLRILSRRLRAGFVYKMFKQTVPVQGANTVMYNRTTETVCQNPISVVLKTSCFLGRIKSSSMDGHLPSCDYAHWHNCGFHTDNCCSRRLGKSYGSRWKRSKTKFFCVSPWKNKQQCNQEIDFRSAKSSNVNFHFVLTYLHE